ncbi:hypothetical protein [Psychromarinibacter halotolerans]|uniref:Uncharacterized protein n=1 Tax=Psychromarinibacter halotolerans TaxID=1775175 RepID=A0ABV7GZN3_9RHOB|nr:hypothetical protein [Psychromarinibacter halotolerans]MDF0596168.1 hypothetical protein [Psychromarinibacter halotolerans]
MGEFAPINALGGGFIPIRAHHAVNANALAPVESSSGGRGAQARMDADPQSVRLAGRGSGREQAETESGPAYRERPEIDDFTLIGPSPAFQANVLELERDLRRAIERLESERSRAEAEAALKIERAEAQVEAAEDAKASAEIATPAPAPAPDVPKAAEPQVAAPTEAETPEPPETTDA